MKNSRTILCTMLLLLLSIHSDAATDVQVVGPSLKYVNSGKITVDTTTSYNLNTSQTWSPLSYIIPYPNGIQGQYTYNILMSLVDLRVIPKSNRINFY